jgi:hypothetical protein
MEEKAIPHGLTKSGSVNAAFPGMSETRLVCPKLLKVFGAEYSNAGFATTMDIANDSIHRCTAHFLIVIA